jgi:hypothetical protein
MSVADSRGRRIDAATGVLAGALILAGFIVQTTPPSPDDPIGEVASYLALHRSGILTGDFLIACGGAVVLWWLGSLRSYLRSAEGGEGRLSAAAFLGGGVGVALTLAAVGVQAGLVLNAAREGDAAVIRFAFDTYNALLIAAAAPFATLIAAASCSAARSGAFPPSAYWLGSLVAGLQIATLPGLFERSGFFAGGGEMAIIGFVALVAWVIGVSLLIVRRAGVPPVARAEP